MFLGIMPNPTDPESDELYALGPLFEQLSPEQEMRVHQIMNSWGFRKHGLPVSEVRRAIKKVLQNFP